MVLVALANVILFTDVSELEQEAKIALYGRIYIYALVIPIVSVSGVFLAQYLKGQRLKKLKQSGIDDIQIKN